MWSFSLMRTGRFLMFNQRNYPLQGWICFLLQPTCCRAVSIYTTRTVRAGVQDTAYKWISLKYIIYSQVHQTHNFYLKNINFWGLDLECYKILRNGEKKTYLLRISFPLLFFSIHRFHLDRRPPSTTRIRCSKPVPANNRIDLFRYDRTIWQWRRKVHIEINFKVQFI